MGIGVSEAEWTSSGSVGDVRTFLFGKIRVCWGSVGAVREGGSSFKARLFMSLSTCCELVGSIPGIGWCSSTVRPGSAQHNHS